MCYILSWVFLSLIFALRTHGYEQKAGYRNSEGYPAICGEIRLVWTDDCAAYYTKLYGYEAVYLPKNHFIKEETMFTEKYLALFFPFGKLDVIKRGIESMWNIQNDRVMMALALTMTDKPTIVWDFHSLLLGVQMMFSSMLTDSENPIKLCRHCTKAFVASRPSAVFCSPQCKNKHNVYKSRARKTSSDKE